MWKIRHALREEATGGETGGAGGGTAQPAAAPAAAPAPAAGAPAGAPSAAAPAAPAAAPAPAAKGAPAAATAPAAAGKEGKEGEGNNEAYWPPDWRKTVSKDDAKVLARLERYASPEAAMQALIAAQNRIAAGELKPVLGKNATPEQVAEYRAALGIPEAPDKYDLGKDAAGIAPELLSPVLKHAHETNQTPEQVKATLKAWSEIQTNVAEQRAEADLDAQTKGEDMLRQEWGPEFRRNINLIHGLLDGAATPGLKGQLLGGRLADGTPIGSSPAALKMLASLALIQNPAGVVVPGAEANPLKGVDDEITKIEKTMRENRTAYNKDEAMQARYRELLGAREKLKPRTAA